MDPPEKCEQCGSNKHVRSDCPAYKITQKFARDVSHGYYYTHYDVPVYDTHCHIDYVFDRFKHKGLSWEEFQQNESFPHNFKGCITSFSDPQGLSTLGISSNLLAQEGIWATFGVHPHHAKDFNAKMEENLRENLKLSKAVGVGECGLDYSLRSASNAEVQKEVFLKQIQLAKEFQKVLVIHSREAEDDVYDILVEQEMQEWPIHIHCFTGDHAQLHQYVNAFPNMCFGFTNLISYPTATTTHQVVKSIPLDRILLETDAPYFVPKSLRSTEQFSHPGNVLFVAEEIASIKGEDVDVVLENCRRNVRKLYQI